MLTICTHTYVKVLNITLLLLLPIVFNIEFISFSIYYVCQTTKNRLPQRRHDQLLAREEYNRSLVKQFLCFYVIWILL